ncbi:MAG TPA: hypothetical protein VNO20_04275 [Solirubrobacterales bacterium]|nr:hypothetical protein [Solirubrobacterales bacterium]
MSKRGIDSVSLEFESDPEGLRRGHTGSAPKEIPYWSLFDSTGKAWARLCLFFPNEESAFNHIREWLNQKFPNVMEHGVHHRLRDVELLPAAKLVRVKYDPVLDVWLRKLMLGIGDRRAPALLSHADFDVARCIQTFHPNHFELLMITEQALSSGRVLCTPGREQVFYWEPAA